MQPARGDMRIALPVRLPWTGDRESAGLQRMWPTVGGKRHRAGFEQTDFEPLVAMKIHAPVLVAARVPEAEAEQAGELARGQPVAGVVAAAEGVKSGGLLTEIM